MVPDAAELVTSFAESCALLGLRCREVIHERLLAPHSIAKLPQGRCGVYVFSLSAEYGARVEAGPHRVLKVGKAGSKSAARFTYQHYGFNAMSTLARSLVHTPILWRYLGIDEVTKDSVATWIREHCDRDHFFLDAGDEWYLDELEWYLHGRLGPVFEGVRGRIEAASAIVAKP